MNPMPELPLRDIHLPPPVPWWPPAPGWWLLLGLVILAAVTVLWLWRRHLRGRRQRAELAALNELFAQQIEREDPQRLLADLSQLLRRIALGHFPRHEVAGLTAEDWLAWLDRPLGDTPHQGGFTRGVGRVLAQGPYAPKIEVDLQALRSLCLAWAKALGRDHR